MNPIAKRRTVFFAVFGVGACLLGFASWSLQPRTAFLTRQEAASLLDADLKRADIENQRENPNDREITALFQRFGQQVPGPFRSAPSKPEEFQKLAPLTRALAGKLDKLLDGPVFIRLDSLETAKGFFFFRKLNAEIGAQPGEDHAVRVGLRLSRSLSKPSTMLESIDSPDAFRQVSVALAKRLKRGDLNRETLREAAQILEDLDFQGWLETAARNDIQKRIIPFIHNPKLEFDPLMTAFQGTQWEESHVGPRVFEGSYDARETIELLNESWKGFRTGLRQRPSQRNLTQLRKLEYLSMSLPADHSKDKRGFERIWERTLFRWQLASHPNSFGHTHMLAYIRLPLEVVDFVDEEHSYVGLFKAGIALSRFRADKGHHAASLEELVQTGYLKEVPIDFFSGKAIRYNPKTYRVWSVGEDEVDDGGKSGKTSFIGKDRTLQLAP